MSQHRHSQYMQDKQVPLRSSSVASQTAKSDDQSIPTLRHEQQLHGMEIYYSSEKHSFPVLQTFSVYIIGLPFSWEIF